MVSYAQRRGKRKGGRQQGQMPIHSNFPFMVLAMLLKICHFWPTVLSVVPLARCVVCRLSVCLSVTFCIVTKRYVLSKKVSEGMNRKPGSKSSFLGRRHISTSSFAATATETAVFALFLPAQPSNRY